MSATLPSFADRRRQARKPGKCEAELRFKHFFKERTVLVSMINVSTEGLSLTIHKWRPSVDQQATVYVSGERDGIRIRCRWIKQQPRGISQSGWTAVDPNDEKMASLKQDNPAMSSDRRQMLRREKNRNPAESKPPRRLSDLPPNSPLSYVEGDLQYRRASEGIAGPEEWESSVGDRRSSRPVPPDHVKSGTLRTLKNCLSALRDLVALCLPRSLSMALTRQADFAFITHPRDASDVQRQFPLARLLPNAILELWLKYQWPVVGTKIAGIRDREGNEIRGWIIFCPLTARQMIRDRDLGRRRVLQTVQLASKMGIKIVGLGAFTSIVTRDGYDVIDRYPLNVTTGNALSAAGAVQNVAAACNITRRDISCCTIAIVGAAGNVGSACAKIFSESAKHLILIDINQKKLSRLLPELQSRCTVETAATPELVINADIVIAVTNAPGAVLKAEHLKPGALVVDAAQPKNVADKVPAQRDDVLVMESSIFRFPGIEYAFDLGIATGEALGCMAETIVLAAAGGKKNYSVGALSSQQVKDIYAAGRLLGIKIGYFRTSSGFVSEDRIQKVISNHRFNA